MWFSQSLRTPVLGFRDFPGAQSLCGALHSSCWVIAAQQASGPLDHQFLEGRTGVVHVALHLANAPELLIRVQWATQVTLVIKKPPANTG